MIYIYAIVDGLEDAGDVRGIEGEPLHLTTIDDITIVTGDLAGAPAVTRTTLAAQDEAVKALHDRAAALLPMRFGAAYASHDDACKALMTHADGLRERLRHVRSREQMVLRITGASAARPTVASGTDYLRTRARPPEIAPLHDALQPFVQDTIVERGQARHVIATVYHLIARSTSAPYRNAVSASAAQLPQLSVRVAGPMACYAFT